MKRQAAGQEEDWDDGNSSDGDIDDDVAQTVAQLNVFCVSAREYLKLRQKFYGTDGKPQVSDV